MTEKEFEMMDDYLSDRLNAEDQAAFEKQVQADPQLAQELNIQKSLVAGLKQARVAELKSMLNNIPVAPVSGGSSVLTKVGTWAVVAGLVVAGIYFWLTKEEDKTGTSENVAVTQQPEATEAPAPQTLDTTPAATQEEPVQPKETVTKKENKSVEKAEPAPSKPIDVYDPSAEEAVDEATRKFESDQLENLQEAFVTSSIQVETDTMHKKYNFHYVFKSSKLILYGAFEKNLYEILEFIGDDERTVVLFYKSNYYLLDVTKEDPTKLVPIRNRKLLKKLQEHRSK